MATGLPLQPHRPLNNTGLLCLVLEVRYRKWIPWEESRESSPAFLWEPIGGKQELVVPFFSQGWPVARLPPRPTVLPPPPGYTQTFQDSVLIPPAKSSVACDFPYSVGRFREAGHRCSVDTLLAGGVSLQILKLDIGYAESRFRQELCLYEWALLLLLFLFCWQLWLFGMGT